MFVRVLLSPVFHDRTNPIHTRRNTSAGTFLTTKRCIADAGKLSSTTEALEHGFLLPQPPERHVAYLRTDFLQRQKSFSTTRPEGFRQRTDHRFSDRKGIALYDTASAVRRLQDNASDKFLEIVEPTNLPLLLKQLPQCRAIVTTGQKATDTLRSQLDVTEPPVGGKSPFAFEDRSLYLYRMPSSSRAYPLKLEKKAEVYQLMFNDLGII